ncbi:type IV toxin-antitoxin system AbiEi family antitoxin domain-containing protein [Microbacterium sp.]|uniref:type IV toxin-antitoxin system AbiEi family antitoxin domain-containing protein n=1 Tax=Microbacterium sp. TaxID=51671 RepID=UPI002E3545B5|nr:type IV toxin-antitoxin system AbiEi family antitoxin domain-containing protein [Microbacterium sp.]
MTGIQDPAAARRAGAPPAAESAATRAMRMLAAERGGVVRTRVFLDAGWGRRAVDRAVSSGALRRVRTGWVATADADANLVAAARTGVVLTCTSQARRLGLWVLDDQGMHVAARAHAGHVGAVKATVHWSRPLVPRHPDLLADPIENVLGLVATCQPFESAFAVWESALNQGLVDVQALRRLKLPPAARRLAEQVRPFSDSGLESIAIPRLRWLRLPLRQQVWIAGHRVDLLIGDRLVLQVDGGHHVGAQRESDISHDAALMLMGYHVIRVG